MMWVSPLRLPWESDSLKIIIQLDNSFQLVLNNQITKLLLFLILPRQIYLAMDEVVVGRQLEPKN